MMSGINPIAQMGQQAGHQLWSGFPGIMQYFFGHSGEPFEKARNAYMPFYNQAQETQNPFIQAGQGGMNNYTNWLGNMKNPSDFINNLMGNYQESPWAKFQQQQGVRAAQNMGSANGLAGSTPLTQFAQQNARNISSEDMGNWLQNVLGINTAYGTGQQNLMNSGQHASDFSSQLASNAANSMGQTAFGEAAGNQMDQNSLWAGIAKMFGG